MTLSTKLRELIALPFGLIALAFVTVGAGFVWIADRIEGRC